MHPLLSSSQSDRDRFHPEQLRRRFSDRQPFIQVFESLLNLAPPAPVLMFHGLGGIGKTYLLRYLVYEYGYCWKDVTCGYPHAFLCFRPGHTPLSAERALWQAREQLIQTKRGIVFTRFDMVWGKLWERSYQMSINRNKELMPEAAVSIAGLLQSMEVVPVIGDIAKSINLLGRLAMYMKKAVVTHGVLGWFREKVEIPTGLGWKTALQSMDLQQLAELLPAAFAADVAESATRLAPPYDRVLVFVDNYERLQAELGESSGGDTTSFVQELAKELVTLKSGVLMVIAGRDRLRWAETRGKHGTWRTNTASLWAQEETRRDAQVSISRFLEQHSIGDLSEADATQYLLERHQWTGSGLASQIYEFTGGFPLALGVAADLVAEVGAQAPVDFSRLRVRVQDYKPLSEEWREEVNDFLLERLLEQLELGGYESLRSLTKAAAIPRWFNSELLWSLVGGIGTEEHFRRLKRYSFVEPYEVVGIQAYRLHSVVRRLLRENIGIHAQLEQWERVALGWFEVQARKSLGASRWRYHFEMLYHLWHINPDEALHRLVDWFAELQSTGEHGLCWDLLDTAAEVENTLPLDFQARLNLCKSDLHLKVWHDKGANRELALQHAEKAVTQAEKGVDEELLADAYNTAADALIRVAVGVSANSGQHFARAVKMLRRVCEVAEATDDCSRLASALLRRASMETDLNPDYGDFSLVDRAIALCQQTGDLRGQRDAYFDKAKLAMRLEQWELVASSLRRAEDSDKLLSPSDIPWRAHAFQVWGEYYTHRQQWNAANEYLEKAKKTCEDLHLVGGICAATGWLGIVQCHLGNMADGLTLVHEALQTEHETLGSQEGVAKWLHYLGELFMSRNELERALQALWLSLSLREVLGHSEARKTKERILEIKKTIGKDLYERLEREFQPGKSEFREYASLWGFDPFRKHEGNPILTPQGDAWEAHAVFNPAAWIDGKKVHLLYRAEGPCDFPGRALTSRIGLAISDDGIHFKREPFPIIEPTEPYEIPGGCEDPRLVRIGDTFYLTYTAYDGKTARLAMATSKDLHSWDKAGPLLPDDQWERFFPREEHRPLSPRGWSKSGAILDQPVNGYYWMYFGDTHIWAAYSRDLRRWEVVDEPVLSPRPDSFDSRLVEPGPPPLLLPEGIWLGYNGADRDLRYAFGQALFAADNPRKLVRRCARPLLEPVTERETEGQVPRVVFGEGLVRFQGKWLLYYGMADSRIGVAFSEVNDSAIVLG